MAFTAKDVQTLRERTGVGMMDCKKALVETDGDMEKAIDILREKGLAAAAKKAGRIAAEGLVYAVVYEDKKVGVVIEVNSETDFVAKNADFQAFVQDVAAIVADKAPANVEELLTLPMGEGDVAAALREKILVIGENLSIRRFERYEGNCVAYVHGGGRIGVLVKFDDTAMDAAAMNECGKDVAMQIAALNPTYLSKESVPAEDLEKETKIRLAEIMNDPKNANKPENIIRERILPGRVAKFFEETCLLEQAFVKDSDMTVGQYVAKCVGDAKVVAFVRFEKGEGLEKRQDDFAAEVASMMG